MSYLITLLKVKSFSLMVETSNTNWNQKLMSFLLGSFSNMNLNENKIDIDLANILDTNLVIDEEVKTT
jgi:hypothetical protein